jgi:dTDP-4-dehydrorhamnose 3,5-epimerase
MMNIEVIETKLDGVKRIKPKCFVDDRGFFMETFSRRTLLQAGIDYPFFQDNLSFSKKQGTIRGLHYQKPPFAQVKLVNVIKGAIWDVAVDIRVSSKTFGEYVGFTLSEENQEQLLIPDGFAHGFITLTEDTIVSYKVTNYYSKEHDTGIAWDDPDLAIAWPLKLLPPLLSLKDQQLPRLHQKEMVFA